MTDSRPRAAASAATASPRCPDDEQQIVCSPSRAAAVPAIAAIRSLKDCVGLAVSSFSHNSMPEQARQPVGVDQRRPARRQAAAVGLHRQERRVAPQGGRPRGDVVTGDRRANDVPVVGDVERTVAAVALFGET